MVQRSRQHLSQAQGPRLPVRLSQSSFHLLLRPSKEPWRVWPRCLCPARYPQRRPLSLHGQEQLRRRSQRIRQGHRLYQAQRPLSLSRRICEKGWAAKARRCNRRSRWHPRVELSVSTSSSKQPCRQAVMFRALPKPTRRRMNR